MGSSAQGLTSNVHIVTFEMELGCYGQIRILLFIPFLLCHQKGTPFHKYYINLSEALAEQNASQYLLSKFMI